MVLSEYSSLDSKLEYFNSVKLDTITDFIDKVWNLAESKDWIFRGVSEAKYKMYTSAQPEYIGALDRYIYYYNKERITLRLKTCPVIFKNQFIFYFVCPKNGVHLARGVRYHGDCVKVKKFRVMVFVNYDPESFRE